ncbi:undecaprenyldiphospho-muramoylpentapeptide beta-N-acetylglucosaminyltransferase [Bosea sp. (in: a-proteobacteria)]|uniref:undecaprenyldiphospho-muramoylpentapeptide beta-N-acetylglucosaminyltransferase n=1 Tax=Bosea sp. (in: a-proteobacteria) TaxID=1871050 RepID=UPI00121132D3|nr:undecaprenyldiphospho-muramoylpentapeptide beta-N-acetylglucosaminyltransferase [Bosea sp. (in: a-proteobacteria)]TAJ26736.1 MAG: undecaprenyldiphospho-muramoylpentapeptide beta-N-acetylglucosaminyltransferase [Bosea sp. (in: a-proteobacteria)]
MAEAPLIMLAAGGTGGHLFPAEALSHALHARGARVMLMTDTRAAGYAGSFPAEALHAVPAATPSGRSPLKMAGAMLKLAQGTFAARRIIGRVKPAVLVGFGGYPTVPPVLGASLAGVRTVIHEQNAVMGRANRFLAGRATLIATGFAEVGGLSDALKAKCRHVGNPVRPAVLEAAEQDYGWPGEGQVRLLVFGGSQGARVMADIVPQAVQLLTDTERARLSIVQQARVEDDARVRGIYDTLGVRATISPFFKDLPAQMAAAHLVIGRSGASTVAELTVIGRPAILVPLPGSLDQDQAANAAFLEKAGGAMRILQADFTPRHLAAELSRMIAQPAHLTTMAANAKSAGIPDAADRLADLVIATAHSQN